MPNSYTGVKASGFCKLCSHELYQYPQDPEGDLRCSRCGHPHPAKPEAPASRTRKVAE